MCWIRLSLSCVSCFPSTSGKPQFSQHSLDIYHFEFLPRSRKQSNNLGLKAVLHVSQEARCEAKKSYQLRTFDTKTTNPTERYIYYNPNCDIIYFGEETCISSMLFTFSALPREPIPRIALTLSGKGGQKCHCDYDDDLYGANIDIRTMQALHGLFPPNIRQRYMYRWPGCLGLEVVFWVVPSNLWSVEQGTISAKVGLRHATTNGLTKGQRSFKRQLLWDMQYVANGQWISGDTNRWEAEKDRPKFSFISFAPHGYDGVMTTFRNGLGCSTPAVNLLRRNDCAFLKYVERTTGVRLDIPPQNYRDEDPREIGFSGTKEGVAGAKKMVLDKLSTSNSDKVYVHRVSDAWEPEWNNIRRVVPGQTLRCVPLSSFVLDSIHSSQTSPIRNKFPFLQN